MSSSSQDVKTGSAGSQPAKAPAPPEKFLIQRCAIDRSHLVAVRRPNGSYYLYNFDSNYEEMTPHVCSCQPQVTEACLQPLYSAYSEKISATVIFVSNTLTSKKEQYVYRFETDHFEQVEFTGLVYNPTQLSNHPVVAMLKGPNGEQVMIERDQVGSLRKMVWRGGCFKVMASSRVETLLMKSVEAYELEEAEEAEAEELEENDEEDWEYDEDPEEDLEKTSFDKYIDSLEPLFISFCPHQPSVVAFNYNTYVYQAFFFNDATGEFHVLECECESKLKIRESHLYPKYMEMAHDNKYVMHVYNSITKLMEKYCIENGGLRQVDYPELVFNSAKTTTSPVLIVSTYQGSTIVFVRDSSGRLAKEQFSSAKCNYVSMVSEPVKTFIVQRTEAEKQKKKEEEKEKEAEKEPVKEEETTQKEQSVGWSLIDQEALREQLAKLTAQTVKRVAEKTDEKEQFALLEKLILALATFSATPCVPNEPFTSMAAEPGISKAQKEQIAEKFRKREAEWQNKVMRVQRSLIKDFSQSSDVTSEDKTNLDTAPAPSINPVGVPKAPVTSTVSEKIAEPAAPARRLEAEWQSTIKEVDQSMMMDSPLHAGILRNLLDTLPKDNLNSAPAPSKTPSASTVPQNTTDTTRAQNPDLQGLKLFRPVPREFPSGTSSTPPLYPVSREEQRGLVKPGFELRIKDRKAE